MNLEVLSWEELLWLIDIAIEDGDLNGAARILNELDDRENGIDEAA